MRIRWTVASERADHPFSCAVVTGRTHWARAWAGEDARGLRGCPGGLVRLQRRVSRLPREGDSPGMVLSGVCGPGGGEPAALGEGVPVSDSVVFGVWAVYMAARVRSRVSGSVALRWRGGASFRDCLMAAILSRLESMMDWIGSYFRRVPGCIPCGVGAARTPEEWTLALDPRIPRRPHEPSEGLSLYFHNLEPVWLRVGVQWWVQGSLETRAF